MQIKIGNDIISSIRIERLCNKYGSKFLEKVFTQKEIEYCEKRKKNKYLSYAARFAAKEAVFKAVSTTLDNKYTLGWKDIEILNDISGRPFVNIKGVNSKIDVSISHEKEYAIASAVAIIE